MPRNNESYNIKEFRNVLKSRLYSVCRMHFYCSGNQLMNCNIKQNKIVPNSNIEDTLNSAISHFFPTPALCHVPLKRSDSLPRHRCHHWNPFSSLAKISLGCWSQHYVQYETEAWNCCVLFFLSIACFFLVLQSWATSVRMVFTLLREYSLY